MIFNCPACKAPIADLSGPGVTEVTCARCRFSYRIFTGHVVACASRTITVRNQVGNNLTEKQLFELQLEMEAGTRRVINFEVEGVNRSISMAANDLVSVVYSLRKKKRIEELLSVVNHTSVVTYELAEVGERSRNVALVLTVGVSALAFAAFVSLGPLVAVLGTGAAGVASHVGFRRLFAPTTKLPPDENRKLEQVRTLLERKQEMEGQLVRVEQERRNRTVLKTRLEQLRAKMESVDPQLYQLRIERVTSAVAMLDQQIRLDDQLVDGYQRTVAMLEIEVESNTHVDELSEDIAEILRDRADQLAAIRERNEDLQLQLAANQEVERLLRGP